MIDCKSYGIDDGRIHISVGCQLHPYSMSTVKNTYNG
jgi:hypothetical protein